MSSDQSAKSPTDPPELGQLAGLVQPQDDSVAKEGARATAEDVDETAATDYYHSVKPKPKAVPIADVGTADQPVQEEPEWRGYLLWVWLLGAAALTAALAVTGVLQPGKRPSPRPADQPAMGVADRAGPRPVPRVSRDTALRDWNPSSTEMVEFGQSDPTRPSGPGEPVRVSFERRGNAILVPARVEGPSGAALVKMVFDTGATYSTVTSKSLAALGVVRSSVRARVATANGVVRRPLAVVEGITVQGAGVGSGLTVGVCDACATADTGGLLGLNYARHFVVTVDHDAGQLILAPKHLTDKTMDIRPFISLVHAKSRRRAEGVVIRFTIRNRAPRDVHQLVIEAAAEGLESRPRTTIPFVAADSQREATIEGKLPDGTAALTFTLEVVRATW